MLPVEGFKSLLFREPNEIVTKLFDEENFQRILKFGVDENEIHLIISLIQAKQMNDQIETCVRKLSCIHTAEVILFILRSPFPQFVSLKQSSDFVLYESVEEFPEILFQMMIVEWDTVKREDLWNNFFSYLVSSNWPIGNLPKSLLECLLYSRNCSVEQLTFIIQSDLKLSPEDYSLVIDNLNSRILPSKPLISSHLPKFIEELFTLLFDKCRKRKGDILFSRVITSLVQSKFIVGNVGHLISLIQKHEVPKGRVRNLLEKLGGSPHIPVSEILDYLSIKSHSKDELILLGIVKRQQLALEDITKILYFSPDNGSVTFENVYSSLLQYQGAAFDSSTYHLQDIVLMGLFSGGQIASLHLMKSIEPNILATIVNSPQMLFNQMMIALRSDIPQPLRKKLYDIHNEDVTRSLLKTEDNQKVMETYLNQKNFSFDVALASNPHLEECHRTKLLNYYMNNKQSFRVWRALATHPKLTTSECTVLSNSKDFDVLFNLAYNKNIKLDASHITKMCSINYDSEDSLTYTMKMQIRVAVIQNHPVTEEIIEAWADDSKFMSYTLVQTEKEFLISEPVSTTLLKYNYLTNSVIRKMCNSATEDQLIEIASALIFRAEKLFSRKEAPRENNIDIFECFDQLISAPNSSVELCNHILDAMPETKPTFSQYPVFIRSTLTPEIQDPLLAVSILRLIWEAQKNDNSIVYSILRALGSSHISSNSYCTDSSYREEVNSLSTEICCRIETPMDAIDSFMVQLIIHNNKYLLEDPNFISQVHFSKKLMEHLYLVSRFDSKLQILFNLCLRSDLSDLLKQSLSLLDSQYDSKNSNTKKENIYFHLLLKNCPIFPPKLLDYFIVHEPIEHIWLLKSDHLSAAQVQTLYEQKTPQVQEYFLLVKESLSNLVGIPKPTDLFSLLPKPTSKNLNQLIINAREGVEIKKFIEFLKNDLEITVPVIHLERLLQSLKPLFDDDTNLTMVSFEQTKKFLHRYLLSANVSQYLNHYLEGELFKLHVPMTHDKNQSSWNKTVFVQTKELDEKELDEKELDHPILFNEEFIKKINNKINQQLSLFFTDAFQRRKKPLGANELKQILENGVTLKSICDHYTKLQIPRDDAITFELVQMFVDHGFGSVKIPNLRVFILEIQAMAALILKTSSNVNNIKDGLVKPIVNPTRILELPFATVKRWYHCMPSVATDGCGEDKMGKFPPAVLTLIAFTSNVQEEKVKNMKCKDVMKCISFLIELMKIEDAKIYLSEWLKLLRNNQIQLVHLNESFTLPSQLCTVQLGSTEFKLNLSCVEDKLISLIECIVSAACNVLTELNYSINLNHQANPFCECNTKHQIRERISLETITNLDMYLQRNAKLDNDSTLDNFFLFLNAMEPFLSMRIIGKYQKVLRQFTFTDVLQVKEYLTAAMLTSQKVSNLLPILEQVHYCYNILEVKMRNYSDSFMSFDSEIQALLKSTESTQFTFSSSFNYCKENFLQIYDTRSTQFKNIVDDICNNFNIYLLTGPEKPLAFKTEKVREAVPVVGQMVLRYDFKLDENSMPIIEDGQFVYDATTAKILRPLITLRTVPKVVPKLQNYNMLLNAKIMIADLPISLLHIIKLRTHNFQEGLELSLKEKYNLFTKCHLQEQINKFKKMVGSEKEEGTGFDIIHSIYSCRVVPKFQAFKKHLMSLQRIDLSVTEDAAASVESYVIGLRKTLPSELSMYIQHLAQFLKSKKCIKSLTPKKIKDKLAEAAVAVAVLKNDINYHTMFNDMSVIGFVRSIVKAMGEQLQVWQNKKDEGTILFAFPCHKKGMGVMFISSHFQPEKKNWEQFLHYSSTGCASRDLGSLFCQSTPPYDLPKSYKLTDDTSVKFSPEAKATFEEILMVKSIKTVVLTFSAEAITETKQIIMPEADKAIKSNNFHNEVGLETSKCLGTINFCPAAEEEQGVVVAHHFRIEAALCNASPILPLVFKNEGLKIVFSTDDLLKDLQSLISQENI